MPVDDIVEIKLCGCAGTRRSFLCRFLPYPVGHASILKYISAYLDFCESRIAIAIQGIIDFQTHVCSADRFDGCRWDEHYAFRIIGSALSIRRFKQNNGVPSMRPGDKIWHRGVSPQMILWCNWWRHRAIHQNCMEDLWNLCHEFSQNIRHCIFREQWVSHDSGNDCVCACVCVYVCRLCQCMRNSGNITLVISCVRDNPRSRKRRHFNNEDGGVTTNFQRIYPTESLVNCVLLCLIVRKIIHGNLQPDVYLEIFDRIPGWLSELISKKSCRRRPIRLYQDRFRARINGRIKDDVEVGQTNWIVWTLLGEG